MRKPIRWIGLLSIVCAVFLGWGASALAIDMGLVGLLTKNLGVTDQQAEGGAGAIFGQASQNMSLEDFTKVTDALPEVKGLMNARPSAESGSGTLGGLSSMLGKSGGSLTSLTGLADTFSKLGLSADMVGKFIPIVLDYAQTKGGDGIASLLKTALQ